MDGNHGYIECTQIFDNKRIIFRYSARHSIFANFCIECETLESTRMSSGQRAGQSGRGPGIQGEEVVGCLAVVGMV